MSYVLGHPVSCLKVCSTTCGCGATRAVFTAFGFLVVTSLLLLLRWAALPRPIPGIPYNRESARRIMGDIPDMKKAKGIRLWYQAQLARHNSPIVQVFNRPLRGPLLLVADAREAQDVLMRRTREFDKSTMTSDSFKCLVGDSHISMKSADHRYKHNKELLRDLMSPAFLNEVSAPEIHRKMTLLLDLWTTKARKADLRPFAADKDLHVAALDIIMAATFDFPQSHTSLAKQVAHIQKHRPADGSIDPQGEPFLFSHADLDPELEAWVYLTQSFSVPFQSPFPYLSHWLYLQTPRSRRALQLRRAVTERNIEQSIKRLEDPSCKKKLRCAVDQILLREQAYAKKHGIQPNFFKGEIFDELFGYILGGHDTVATVLAWWVKLMGRFQPCQSRLRADLYAAHAAARAEGRLPTAREITAAHVPYLEAVIEETLRYTHIVPGVIRQATCDTHILGHAIPRGTHVFFITSAAGFKEPAFAVREDQRAETARRAGGASGRCGEWDPADIGEFAPRRWLRSVPDDDDDDDGSGSGSREVFDPRAGPQLAFGAGPRGCFGRKLAYLELRIAITMLLWRFEFLELPSAQNSFGIVDAFALLPENCFVKLRVLDL
ncbi:cytochrome P450 [Echria macrotheca]|uniref:Cytochrome P450 n=1 Tax=Echria macrotheca TaxID=438768 RepID=A0AAJ0BIZ7_9PEZI|nr:cytochrome P450 [Echria macrotheca]